MFKIIEIILISVTGAAALVFIISYIIREVKGKNRCSGCAAFDSCEEFKKKSNRKNECKERVN